MGKFKFRTDAIVSDSTGETMIVGNKYEMRADIAQGAWTRVGLVFNDRKDYSFIYTGTVETALGVTYILSTDVFYDPDVMPADVYQGSQDLKAILNGHQAVCPTFVAAQFVRPYTGE